MHQAGHLVLGEGQLLPAPFGQRDVGWGNTSQKLSQKYVRFVETGFLSTWWKMVKIEVEQCSSNAREAYEARQ